MVEIYVGTSGWMYDWNLGGNFDWYVRNSGLNAVELNASFYRFPFRNQIVSWARKGRVLRWSVKVHRSITHLRRLSLEALATWSKFRELFKPLDPYIDFYLFQMPPSFQATPSNIERVREFAKSVGLGPRFAIEFRHPSWFRGVAIELCKELGITVVSVDAPPPIGTWVATSNGIVYLRMHGRTAWYAHDYSDEELLQVAKLVAESSPKRVYVFFNNDHWMLENARKMMRILSEVIK